MVHFSRIPAPGRRAWLLRLGTACLLTGSAGFFLDDIAPRATAIAVVMTVVLVNIDAVTVQDRRFWVALPMAAVGGLGLTQSTSVLSLHFWTQEVFWRETWWPYTYVTAALILAVAYVLLPLVPVVVSDLSAERRWVGRYSFRVAAVVAVGLSACWLLLDHYLGGPSADLIIAAVMVVLLRPASRHRFFAAGVFVSAILLTMSAFTRYPPPSGVTGYDAVDATSISVQIAPGDRLLPEATDMEMAVLVNPSPPTLLGCRSAVDVSVSIIVPHPADDDAAAKKAAEETTDALLRSPYVVTISGATRITAERFGQGVANPGGRSSVVNALPERGGLHTEYRGVGLATGGETDDVDWFDFSVPSQRQRAMGSCYLEIPAVNTIALDAGTGYFLSPDAAKVSVLPGLRSTIDPTAAQPAGTRDPENPGEIDWACFDYSRPTAASSSGPSCPALATTIADWADAYVQVLLLLTGALLAIAAERWLSGESKTSHEPKRGRDGAREPARR